GVVEAPEPDLRGPDRLRAERGVAAVEHAARLVDGVADDVLALAAVHADGQPVRPPGERVVARTDAEREALLRQVAVVLVAELRMVVPEPGQVLPGRTAGLATVRVAQHAVGRVVRLRELLVQRDVADVHVEVRVLRGGEPEVRAPPDPVVVVVVKRAVLVALLAGQVEVVRLAAAANRDVRSARDPGAQRVRLAWRLLRVEARVVLGPVDPRPGRILCVLLVLILHPGRAALGVER